MPTVLNWGRLDQRAAAAPAQLGVAQLVPVKAPEKMHLTIFRENVEDVYAGIEWEAGSDAAEHGVEVLEDSIVLEIFSPVREDYLPKNGG